MHFSVLGWRHIVVLGKNVIKGTQRGKAGLVGNFDNADITALQKLYSIFEPKAVDVVGKAETQRIAEQMADMTFTDAQVRRYLT